MGAFRGNSTPLPRLFSTVDMHAAYLISVKIV